MKKSLIIAGAALVALALVTTGCRRVPLSQVPGNDIRTESETVALQGATSADVEFRMGVGTVRVSAESSATDLMRATFDYSPASWKPEVSYSTVGGVGDLRVAQPETVRDIGDRSLKNEWTITLGGGVPLDASFKLGVGRNEIDLRGLDVSALEVITGVGDTVLDLSGPRSRDLPVRIDGGVGNLTVRLPRNVGVRVVGVRGEGLGHLKADGFAIDGDDLVNQAWSGSGPKIDVRMTRGIGNVTLLLVD